eukprot:3984281-Pyramimonas_sp.AAC.1
MPAPPSSFRVVCLSAAWGHRRDPERLSPRLGPGQIAEAGAAGGMWSLDHGGFPGDRPLVLSLWGKNKDETNDAATWGLRQRAAVEEGL